jgi:YHS domain-containing protein
MLTGNPMKKPVLSPAAIALTWTLILTACSAPLAPVNVDANGVALKGYDAVAYFTLGRPVKGKKEYQFEWENVKWLFSSSQHLALFQKNPERYAPQYGGY